MNIGLISDTHGYLDPAIPKLFRGVDHILHAGDIGPASILRSLEDIAPVTAVLGNNDYDPTLRETEILTAEGLTILIQHIVTLDRPDPRLDRRIEKSGATLVVFGHTHLSEDRMVRGVRFVNPGYAGRPRGGEERRIALARIRPDGLDIEWMDLNP